MNTFPKNNKLCGQTRISAFYKESKRFVQWPVRVNYRPVEGDTKVLIWAPKSLFKHAVDRNHLRRLMREAYRLHQDKLMGHYEIAFNYIDKELQDFVVVERGIRKALTKIENGNSKVENHPA